VLAAGSAAAITEVEDVDGGPLGGCWRDFQQRPPSKLETSMAAPWGVLSGFLTAATTEVGDVNGEPPGGVVRISGSGHHQSWRRRW
jgi:hypothetical protein